MSDPRTYHFVPVADVHDAIRKRVGDAKIEHWRCPCGCDVVVMMARTPESATTPDGRNLPNLLVTANLTVYDNNDVDFFYIDALSDMETFYADERIDWRIRAMYRLWCGHGLANAIEKALRVEEN